ncbi:zf-HC2 domain-containing protein [Effusibacillus lacus]|uniref:Anti-sigma-W factor RsiW n=1 Tax=Effusibacillus lacus TaxID=1348429 RepID=A0A292YI89_9BACL|nr:zf-HC2 domain-containing protein [Effusibacillus lacus]TCS68531.1 putative zinc finger protein [Effusibacillus lacus]GAX88413.1 hypothetical protein EFBL_0022 [Effusibacillus lacus]
MDCKDLRKNMQLLLDDELEGAFRDQVEQHITGCPDCRQHYVELGLVVHKLSSAEWQKAPAGFTENVLEALEHAHLARRNWRVPLVRWTGLTAAAAFIFSLGVWWSMPNHFSVTANSSEGLIVKENQVIIPKGQEYKGNLIIHNGSVIVEGKVDGNIVAMNGQIYKQTGADISGHTKEINEALQMVGYYLEEFWTMVRDALK